MSVKLYYYDGCARGEPIRWVLHYGGITFEDVRIPAPLPDPPIPPNVKSKCRWGQIPLVEFEGKSLLQSLTIGRYFANKVGLIPSDPYQAALCDEYVDAVQDYENVFWPIIFETPDEKEKAEKLKKATPMVKTRFLDVFESIIKANGGKHLVKDTFTWADIYLAQAIEQFEIILGLNLAEGHEHVNKLKQTVMTSPKIKDWLDKRPKSEF